MDRNNKISALMIHLNAQKMRSEAKFRGLESEREAARLGEGVHLRQYENMCIYKYLSWYVKDLWERLERLKADNNITKNQVDTQNKRVVYLYSHLVLLFVKLIIFKSKVVPAGRVLKGDLNNYITIEDFLEHIRRSNMKVLLSYSVFGNIQKFIGPKVRLSLNLNEGAVGVCLLKYLFKNHLDRVTEDLYFETVNSGEARRLREHKYDSFVEKNFPGEDEFDLKTSKELLEWMVRNVEAALCRYLCSRLRPGLLGP